MIYNGQPIADPLVRFAAFPTFLVITGLAVLLTLIPFFGLGIIVFMGTLLLAFILSILIAPYFWPVLVIIMLIMALMSYNHAK